MEKESKNSLAQEVVQRTLVIPPQESQQEYYNQVSIIRGLSTENDLSKIELRLRGWSFDTFKGVWIKKRKAIMNDIGIGNFMASLQALADNVNFSNFEEKEIPKLALMFFEDNYSDYLVYMNEFQLDPKDFNIIKTILKFYSLSILKNAKGAGHRNVVRGTLSEGILARALGSGESEKKKKGLFSFLRRNKEQ